MPSVWKMSAGPESQFRKEFVENNLMAFGAWDEGDLRNYSKMEELKDKMQQYSKRTFGRRTTSHNETWRFRNLETGDLVILYGNKAIIAIGIVTGPYRYDPKNVYVYKTGKEGNYFHIRPVEWIKVFDPPVKEISQKLLTKMSKPSDTLHEIKDARCILEIAKILAYRY